MSSAVEPDNKPKAKPRWRGWVRDLGIAFAVVLLVQAWQGRNLVAGKAPALAGMLISGQPLQTEAYLGKPYLVHFWAEWCPVCRMEESSIDSIARDHPVIGVAVSSGDAAEVRKHLAVQGLAFDTLLDEEGRLLGDWGARGVPTSFVVDANGEIRFATSGYTTELGLRLRLWVAGWF